MKFTTGFITLLFICLGLPFFSFAQGDPPPDPIDTPLDSWLVILICAGAAYGYMKFKKRTRTSSL